MCIMWEVWGRSGSVSNLTKTKEKRLYRICNHILFLFRPSTGVRNQEYMAQISPRTSLPPVFSKYDTLLIMSERSKMSTERWRTILEFPRYEISDYGNIYNTRFRILMRTSRNNYGHGKITLTDYDGSRHTRSLAILVAEAFVSAPNYMCDHLIFLDGDLTNINANNLAWRPRGFAWKYMHQLRVDQPNHYHNLPVFNVVKEREYSSIIEAGMSEGLLFDDIWRSTYRGTEIFPNGSIFEVIKRV